MGVYAPTFCASDQEKEKFYGYCNLQVTIENASERDLLAIRDYWNARVGSNTVYKQWGRVVGNIVNVNTA